MTLVLNWIVAIIHIHIYIQTTYVMQLFVQLIKESTWVILWWLTQVNKQRDLIIIMVRSNMARPSPLSTMVSLCCCGGLALLLLLVVMVVVLSYNTTMFESCSSAYNSSGFDLELTVLFSIKSVNKHSVNPSANVTFATTTTTTIDCNISTTMQYFRLFVLSKGTQNFR